MDAKQYFKDNQKELIQIANTEVGRFLLGIKDKDPVVKIVPHGYHQLRDFVNGKPVIQAKFFWEEKMNVLANALTKIQIAREYKYKYPEHIYLASFTSSTYLGGAGYLEDQNATFATMRDGATADSTAATFQAICDKGGGGAAYRCRRIYLPIDTSSMGVGSVVTAGTLDFEGNRSLSGPSENIVVRLTGTAQSDTAALATSEWGNKGAGDQWATSTLTEVNNTATAEQFTLSATGIAGINVTGVTKMGVRENTYDIGNSAPTSTDGNTFVMSGTKLLTLTYTPGASGSSGFFSFF